MKTPYLVSRIGSALRCSWGAESCDVWRAECPAAGQCSPSSLVAQDLLGGVLLKTRVAEGWHFYNEIAGRRVDFTAEQFATPLLYLDMPATRQDALADCTAEQYLSLKRRVEAELAKS